MEPRPRVGPPLEPHVRLARLRRAAGRRVAASDTLAASGRPEPLPGVRAAPPVHASGARGHAPRGGARAPAALGSSFGDGRDPVDDPPSRPAPTHPPPALPATHPSPTRPPTPAAPPPGEQQRRDPRP